jgi:hypothetical protein
VSSVEPEVFCVGGAGFADSQTIEAQQDGETGVVPVLVLGREEECREFGAIQAPLLVRMNLRSSDVLRRVGINSAVDVGEPRTDRHGLHLRSPR